MAVPTVPLTLRQIQEHNQRWVDVLRFEDSLRDVLIANRYMLNDSGAPIATGNLYRATDEYSLAYHRLLVDGRTQVARWVARRVRLRN
jgi:hypothetical protein